MLAVHFGAGNIGRGFIGKLLSQSGYDVCFVDINETVIDALNQQKQYTVEILGQEREEIVVDKVRGINSKANPQGVVDAIAEADLITTAVGPTVLKLISSSIKEGIEKRIESGNAPVNIIACENMIGGSTMLKEAIEEQMDESQRPSLSEYAGFPDAAVDRIVPNQTHEDPLTVAVEPFYEWAVDKTMMVGDVPEIKGITYVEDLAPYIERKLFTVNTGHAMTAYLGYLAGAETIKDALENDSIYKDVKSALEETGALLQHKYSFDPEVHGTYIEKILARFLNPHLVDEVTRVGRAPIRKVGPKDRLTGPASQLMKVEKEPTFLAKGIAAALRFDPKEDEEAVQIQEVIQNEGLSKAITTFTGVEEGSQLFELIKKKYDEVK
ncbi:mannitol-1-phosphate 5-dehydrogenase [Guptibacillus algicola]|uniref:mannitol-1-phosphate 5-dehydrogenase n=1 Tax=Guptibacillus algicola TaxID=225844 RepID=UPI001CD4FB9F|nr:mannitol-1-phosphate 5-dehydrogenase [Alkalihalobacillus algicola]MCA0987601.1 mannitol-1-phosphate 5-dehydrogenase [Alkalihalobacillus algicola]